MLRFVARALIARQHGLCRTGSEAATVYRAKVDAVAAQRVDRTENVSGPDLKPRMLVETAIGTKRTNWADAMTSAVGGRAAFAFQGREGSF
jgi:hypothetical protein